MKNNQRGISIINCILLIIVVVFAFFIATILFNNYTQTNSVQEITAEEEKTSTKENTYYFRQMDKGAKIMYNTIIKNIDSLKSGNMTIEFPKSDEISDTKFQTAWDALKLDRPEIFYANTDNISIITKKTIYFGNTSYTYTLQPKDGTKYFGKTFASQSDIETAILKVQSISNSVKANAIGSRYDKVKYVHDYLLENIDYDKEGDLDNSNIYGALVKQKAVCEGYASAYKYLLDELGIPCVSVYGYATGEGKYESHAWNYIQMDDEKWYAVDTTWDDPILIGSGTIPTEVRYKYFLKGSTDFFEGHKEDGDVSGTGQKFIYPTISTTNYSK